MNWLRRLMVGRYGVDQLSIACLIGVLLLLIIARLSLLAIFNWLALIKKTAVFLVFLHR